MSPHDSQDGPAQSFNFLVGHSFSLAIADEFENFLLYTPPDNGLGTIAVPVCEDAWVWQPTMSYSPFAIAGADKNPTEVQQTEWTWIDYRWTDVFSGSGG